MLTLLTAGYAHRMSFPGQQWEAATPQSQGIDPGRLREAISWLESRTGKDGVREIFIVRNGRVVHAGQAAVKMHGVWSVTKTFTSTSLGLLIDDGKATLDTPAEQVLPELEKHYPALLLRHFATMGSGYRAANDEPIGNYKHGPSRAPYDPGPPLFTPPGSRFVYWDSAMNQFARALTRIAREPLAELFRSRIARPIGMSDAGWNWGVLGEVDGIPIHCGAGNHAMMKISAREIARLGHLFLNAGKWRDRQLISEAWVKAATSNQLSPGMAESGGYGFNWWTNQGSPGAKLKWPGVPPAAFAASGYNNNDMFVIPEWRMVVVRLGLDEAELKISDEVYAEFLHRLGTAIASHP